MHTFLACHRHFIKTWFFILLVFLHLYCFTIYHNVKWNIVQDIGVTKCCRYNITWYKTDLEWVMCYTVTSCYLYPLKCCDHSFRLLVCFPVVQLNLKRDCRCYDRMVHVLGFTSSHAESACFVSIYSETVCLTISVDNIQHVVGFLRLLCQYNWCPS